MFQRNIKNVYFTRYKLFFILLRWREKQCIRFLIGYHYTTLTSADFVTSLPPAKIGVSCIHSLMFTTENSVFVANTR